MEINSKEDTEIEVNEGEISFMIQLMISKDSISLSSPLFRGLKDVTFYIENGFYKYIVGNEIDMESASQLCREIRKKGFKDAFVIAFREGKRIPMVEAQ
jgi:N-acetylmuramoyl-L-alanine amidase